MRTKNAPPQRRTLRFRSLDDLLADTQMLVAAGVQAHGKWSTGQVIAHVASVIDASVEGVRFTLPFPMRILGRLIRNRSLKKGLPSGIKIPGKARSTFAPPASLTVEQAIGQLIAAVEKAKQRRMTAVSPVFGKLNHEQWVQLHCRHAELHFSFLSPVSQLHDASHTQDNGSDLRHASSPA